MNFITAAKLLLDTEKIVQIARAPLIELTPHAHADHSKVATIDAATQCAQDNYDELIGKG